MPHSRNRKQRKKSKTGRGVGKLPSTSSSQEQGVDLGHTGNLPSVNHASQDEKEKENKVICDSSSSDEELELCDLEMKRDNMSSQVAVEPRFPQEILDDFFIMGPKNKKIEKTVETRCLIDTNITCSVTNQGNENTLTNVQESSKTTVEVSHTANQMTPPDICEDGKSGPRVLNINVIPVQNNDNKLSSTNLVHTECHFLMETSNTTSTTPSSKKNKLKKGNSKSQEKLNGSCYALTRNSNELETLGVHTSNVNIPTGINNSLNEEHKENSWSISDEQFSTESPEDKDEPCKDLPWGGSSKKKGKTKWTKLDLEFGGFYSESKLALLEGRVYDATVLKMNRYSFVALVKGNLEVFVYNTRFCPRGANEPLESNVPIACFLKIGDCVKLTVTDGRTKKKDWNGWLAQECWQEECEDGPESIPGAMEAEGQSIIISVGKRSAQLANDIIVHTDVLFLCGFHLAHDQVNLEDIFQPGDEISYILHHDHTQRSNPHKVAKAWYGSLPANIGDKQSVTHQQQLEVMNFFKSRTSGIPTRIVTSVCRLNKKSEAAEDGFEKLYRDVFSEEVTTDHTLEQHRSLGIMEMQASVEKKPKHIHGKKPTKHTSVWCKNGAEEDTSTLASWPLINSSLKNEWTRNTKKLMRKVSMVDATTQTLATGEILCFYSIHNGDSD